MRKKYKFKYWVRQVHLWIGLATGLIVLIVSLTGCLFVFQKEITELLHPDRYFVTQPGEAAPELASGGALGQALPVSLLQQKAQRELGADRPITNIVTFREPYRSWEFMAYRSNDTAVTYFGAIEYYQSVFINPYTGVITGTRDYKYDFFNIVKFIHWSLLLNTPYGQPIVGYCTLLFTIMLLTGLILWWPKKWTRAYRERSFRIKWRASFKRMNYDAHKVPGFYVLLPALVLAFTGMVFAFRWFLALVYVLAAGTTAYPAQKEVKSTVPAGTKAAAMDIAYHTALSAMPDAERIGISPASGREGTLYLFGYKGRETYYGADVLQFDQYTGQFLYRRNNREKNRGERLIEMNYDIHVGAIGGLAGKALAFIIALVCASLPVTGFLVWWGRRKGG